jgi:hypothetical protein
MQVGSSTGPSAQLQALENAAAGKYQTGQDFSFLLQLANGTVSDASTAPVSAASSSGSSSGDTTDTGSSNAGSSSSGSYLMSGSVQQGSLIAVGTMTSSGQMVPFSQQQVQSEEAAANNASQTAYSDSLQNFMTLSQASGQMEATTLSDKEQFTADNGLVSGFIDTNFSLKPA